MYYFQRNHLICDLCWIPITNAAFIFSYLIWTKQAKNRTNAAIAIEDSSNCHMCNNILDYIQVCSIFNINAYICLLFALRSWLRNRFETDSSSLAIGSIIIYQQLNLCELKFIVNQSIDHRMMRARLRHGMPSSMFRPLLKPVSNWIFFFSSFSIRKTFCNYYKCSVDFDGSFFSTPFNVRKIFCSPQIIINYSETLYALFKAIIKEGLVDKPHHRN